MQLSQIAILSLFGFALATPQQQKRAASDIEGDISTLSSGLTAFHTAIKDLSGSIEDDQATTYLTTYAGLMASLKEATSHIKSADSLASSDSETIHSAVDSLTTEVVDTLKDANSKASIVASSDYSSQVCQALSTLTTETDDFYDALEDIIDSDYVSDVDDFQSTVESSFSTTKSTYGC
ncbi:hypothetical protein VMCG_09173 [Cytospora schulzeri]|uniref:Uncharacterized protein n=1 Tax=Cytospora schulzeri TaxID=448051 RepID=A0A423VLG8_9PEZI|nr:hypothetical protein VMCG_09173 [Valsa malicola]